MTSDPHSAASRSGRPRLGELLLRAGALTEPQLKEALESQVIHGGRLGTNLLELGLIDEQTLAAALGKQLGVQHASGKMVPDPRALALLSAEEADRRDVLPMRVDATRLSVAVLDPGDLETLDWLAFKTGRRVIPVVVPEFRMHQLLRAHCDAFRSLRALDLEGPRKREASGAQAPLGPELTSEEEFQALYAQALAGGGAAVGAGAREEEILEGKPLVDEAARPVVAERDARSARSASPVDASAPEPTALSFQDAQAQLAASDDREAIAQTVLRFAVGKWRRVLLLSVQRGYVLGWRGLGAGVKEGAVRRIAVPLRPGNTFRLVRDTRAHFVGPLKRDAATQVFAQLLGGGFPTTAVMLPLLVRGKVVHVLYVDNGPNQLTSPDVGELLILSQSVARSYELLIQKRARG